MSGGFERRQCLVYVANAIRAMGQQKSSAKKIINWFLEDAAKMGIDVESVQKAAEKNGVTSQKWRAVWNQVERSIEAELQGTSDALGSRLDKNILAICDYFCLDLVEQKIFTFAVFCSTTPAISALARTLDNKTSSGIESALSAMLAFDEADIASRISPTSRLMENGLVKNRKTNSRQRYDDEYQDWMHVPVYIVNVITNAEPGNISTLLAGIIGVPATTDLAWNDYSHLGEQRSFAANILRGALSGGEAGVNILLYGPPGTGKTEFCKVLAAHIGVDLYQVGEFDDYGNEPNRLERIEHLRLAQQILARGNRAVILFDEMEDLLPSRHERCSKVFINRLFENTKVPILWTCNDLSNFDMALLRRMTLAIEVKIPPQNIREQVWRRNLANCPIAISDADLRMLAREPDASPGLASSAVRAANMAGGGAEYLRMAVSSVTKAMRGGIETVQSAAISESFNMDYANADMDLAHLTDCLTRQGGTQAFSLCLFGPPGTGKSAYIRYLAERLGYEVIIKRASDLFGSFVGENEKNIAEAFAEARDQRAFLIFDEVDSLLADRALAQRNWEVSQVNEMLTWMESHPLPFACTTNLMGRLDPASLRRFTMKIRFTYLRPEQAVAAFTDFFGIEPPPKIRDLTALTPGDFAVVKRKAEILGATESPSKLLSMLSEECTVKPNVSRPIGFR